MMKHCRYICSIFYIAALIPQFVYGLAGRAFLVTGANKGQGFALCKRILTEHDDTHVFLCSRSLERGQEAAAKLGMEDRVDVVQLDVTSDASVRAAVEQVRQRLGGSNGLQGLVSNAGILWDHSLKELTDVCTVGVKRVLDGYLQLMDEENGRVIVVSSGLSPLMHAFSEYADTLKTADWDGISSLMNKCLSVETDKNGDPAEYEAAGFPGGPFAEAVPDFHRYGLAKMFADSYMSHIARQYPKMLINSADPGLVYTDLIDKMPKYNGMSIEETGAKTPEKGVEVHMQLLFGLSKDGVEGSGKFYAMNKEGKLTSGAIDKRPDV